jgi:hypothetical protein
MDGQSAIVIDDTTTICNEKRVLASPFPGKQGFPMVVPSSVAASHASIARRNRFGPTFPSGPSSPSKRERERGRGRGRGLELGLGLGRGRGRGLGRADAGARAYSSPSYPTSSSRPVSPGSAAILKFFTYPKSVFIFQSGSAAYQGFHAVRTRPRAVQAVWKKPKEIFGL